MAYLVTGLILFLGIHSIRIATDSWRTAAVARIGEGPYKGIYSVLALTGLFLIVAGFSIARETPVVLWTPPMGLRHGAALLTFLAFIFLAAAYVPGNTIRARLHHPMVLGVKAWALSHLMATGQLAHLILFAAFLVWAVFDFVSLQRRDRAHGTVYAPGNLQATLLTVAIGGTAWALFAFIFHGWLIGIRPFG